MHSVDSESLQSPLSSPLSEEDGDQRDAGVKVLLQRLEGRKVVAGMVGRVGSGGRSVGGVESRREQGAAVARGWALCG